MGSVRIGKVNSVNPDTREVRVFFPDENMMSGWLRVLKNPPHIPSKDGEQKTDSKSGGSGYSAFESHYHNVTIAPWMPSVDEVVLCIYGDAFNDDGYVLGAL